MTLLGCVLLPILGAFGVVSVTVGLDVLIHSSWPNGAWWERHQRFAKNVLYGPIHHERGRFSQVFGAVLCIVCGASFFAASTFLLVDALIA